MGRLVFRLQFPQQFPNGWHGGRRRGVMQKYLQFANCLIPPFLLKVGVYKLQVRLPHRSIKAHRFPQIIFCRAVIGSSPLKAAFEKMPECRIGTPL